jgi:hypothetical protein
MTVGEAAEAETEGILLLKDGKVTQFYPPAFDPDQAISPRYTKPCVLSMLLSHVLTPTARWAHG